LFSAILHWNDKAWQRHSGDFEPFIAELTQELGRSERRIAATRYVEGLLLEGQRKSIAPMASRLGVDPQGLQQFVADSPWSAEVLWSAIRRQVIPSFEPIESWIIDETGWLKQGKQSVGVSHQYCGAVGKQANCQVSVELVVSDGSTGVAAGGRLYLPESWCRDPDRCRKAGVPAEVGFRTKPQIALEIIDLAVADGVAPAPVLADSVYGNCSEFRKALEERDLEFFLQVTPTAHKGWTCQIATVKKFKRRYVKEGEPAAKTLLEIAQELPCSAWRRARWKATNGTTRHTRLAWKEVWLAHGLRNTEGELEKRWLVVDWPEGEDKPYHCFLAYLKRPPSRAGCLRLSRSRWQIEQYFQRAKDDLGLDHYEGRSWRGFHHHLVLSAVAYLFVAAILARSKKNFWADVGESSREDEAVASEILRLLSLLSPKI
jgi:SRSO17 transposase